MEVTRTHYIPPSRLPEYMARLDHIREYLEVRLVGEQMVHSVREFLTRELADVLREIASVKPIEEAPCGDGVVQSDAPLVVPSGQEHHVALSVSDPEPEFCDNLEELHAVYLDISRRLLMRGVHLSYGGHLKPGGYTSQLFGVLETLRAQGVTDVPTLTCWRPWPMLVSPKEELHLEGAVNVAPCRPVFSEFSELLARSLSGGEGERNAVNRLAWSLGLSDMRSNQTLKTCARIAIGGRIGTPERGYMGRMPGVLEEVLFSIRSEKPVYIVGGFGGCARLIVDALWGDRRAELTDPYHAAMPHADGLRKLSADFGVELEGFDEVYDTLRVEYGWKGLKNGLTLLENLELSTCVSAPRIVELVLQGLRNVASSSGSATQFEGFCGGD